MNAYMQLRFKPEPLNETLNEAKILRPRPELRGRGRGQGYEVEAKAKWKDKVK